VSWLTRRSPPAEPSRPASDPALRSENPRPRSVTPERLTTLNLARFLKDHPRVVVDVWAPWCGPCRAFAPTFAAAAHEWGERVGFGKIHADHEASLVARFGVRSIPSLLFFRDGELVRTETGVLSPERLDRQLRKVFRDLL
jgi:thioredoxin